MRWVGKDTGYSDLEVTLLIEVRSW